MDDPWTQTTEWGLTEGARGGGVQRGKNWDNWNRINNNLKKKSKTNFIIK